MNKTVGMYGGKFIPLHNGHIYAMLKAKSYVDHLYVVVSYVEDRDTELCEYAKLPDIPYKLRVKWLKQITKDMEGITVLAVEDVPMLNNDIDYVWEEGARRIKEAIPETITHIFSSEYEYEKYFTKNYKNAQHIVLDANRDVFDISATTIRNEGIYKHWDMIPKVAQPYFIKKVAIVGTESCGKSTLVKNLATLFNTNYVEEYGRTRCEELGDGSEFLTNLNYMEFSIGQKHDEYRKSLDSNKYLFIDSEAVITKYYAEIYGEKNLDILDYFAREQEYDLYIYLEPDVKWVADGYRKHGSDEERLKNSEKLKKMYADAGIELVILSGSYQDKLEKSIELINKIEFKNHKYNTFI